ncbi:MAG: type II toxin-antitoxin system HipA family toxin [Cyanobacteria bacterium P01_H01_bin.74]
MDRHLDVYLHDNYVGELIQDEHGQLVFDYAVSWLEDPNAVPLSQSIPLRTERFSRKECRAFFAGILPEERKRELIAKNLGISSRNDFAMLEQIGGECAGAITFLPKGQHPPKADYNYRPLSDYELAEILQILPKRPLMAGEDGIRLSLAGAQDKLAVHVSSDGQLSIPLNGAPSTHILKPRIELFEGVVFNEAFCMELAAAIDLPVAPIILKKTDSLEYLLVERYDRHLDEQGRTQRLHQEDFCQALGIVSEMKYQNEGGPNLAQCFQLLRNVSSVPVSDLQHLLRAVIFNLLVGNNDAHGKNFSLLYGLSGSTRLSPFYDILSTAFYPELSPKMAMKISKEYDSNKIHSRHFEKLAEEVGLGKALVLKEVKKTAERILGKLPTITIYRETSEKVANFIRERCLKLSQQFNR